MKCVAGRRCAESTEFVHARRARARRCRRSCATLPDAAVFGLPTPDWEEGRHTWWNHRFRETEVLALLAELAAALVFERLNGGGPRMTYSQCRLLGFPSDKIILAIS